MGRSMRRGVQGAYTAAQSGVAPAVWAWARAVSADSVSFRSRRRRGTAVASSARCGTRADSTPSGPSSRKTRTSVREAIASAKRTGSRIWPIQ
ncbi:hypothetical protein A4U61_08530 [Streptomyces sp. H-KF8]|nr:hypothetical protein A4U61_08530 [Streptomyces sp. H-KF8]